MEEEEERWEESWGVGGTIQGQITRKGAHSQDVSGELSRTRSPAQLLVEGFVRQTLESVRGFA